MSAVRNNFPKLHNAAWPGVVGKGSGGEQPLSLDTMLDLTASAEVDGLKFDGIVIRHVAQFRITQIISHVGRHTVSAPCYPVVGSADII